MKIEVQIPDILKKAVGLLSENNCRAYLVGGAVLDALMRKPIKDWDVECYGLNFNSLSELLKKFGKTSLVGKAFGIIKLRAGEDEYDFSIPRRDNKIGIGHTGFSVELDPDLSIKDAARRRDLTINSIYLNLQTLEIEDPFNGVEDLKDGRIKATDPVTFIEDPLRVLRIMQILPRKGRYVDPETIDLCKSMIDEFDALPRERLFGEFSKLLNKSDGPSLGLHFLADCGWINKFPELAALRGTPQRPEQHPEGDVWRHTMIAVDNAAKLRGFIPDDWKAAYMFGMLCHDMGKPATTDPVKLTAHNHEVAGVDVANTFMHRLTNNIDLIEKTLSVVKNHRKPYILARDSSSPGAWKRLHIELPLHVAAYVTQADRSPHFANVAEEFLSETETILQKSDEFGKEKIHPALNGGYLIKKGLKPGPHFKKIISAAFEIQLDEGITDPDILYTRVENHNM